MNIELKEKDELSLILRSHGPDLTSGIKQIMPVTNYKKLSVKKKMINLMKFMIFLKNLAKQRAELEKLNITLQQFKVLKCIIQDIKSIFISSHLKI